MARQLFFDSSKPVIPSSGAMSGHGPRFETKESKDSPASERVFIPSDPNNLNLDQNRHTASSSDKVWEYIKRELPGLLPKDEPSAAAAGRFVVVPPTFALECPFVHQTRQKGWWAEKKVFNWFKSGLAEFQKNHPEYIVALFHSLRYSTSCSNPATTSAGDDKSSPSSSTRTTPAAENKNKEYEIDFVLLSYNGKTGGHSAILVEVKCGDSTRDVLKNNNWKAILQPVQHLVALKTELKSTLDGVKLCVAVVPAPKDQTNQKQRNAPPSGQGHKKNPVNEETSAKKQTKKKSSGKDRSRDCERKSRTVSSSGCDDKNLLASVSSGESTKQPADNEDSASVAREHQKTPHNRAPSQEQKNKTRKDAPSPHDPNSQKKSSNLPPSGHPSSQQQGTSSSNVLQQPRDKKKEPAGNAQKMTDEKMLSKGINALLEITNLSHNVEEELYRLLPTLSAGTNTDPPAFLLLSGAIFEGDDGQLKEWLEKHLQPSVRATSSSDFQSLLTWCVQRSLGVVISEASSAMDQTSTLITNNTPEQPPTVALLTMKQQKLLQLPVQVDSSHQQNNPQLITGESGTGKTFIVQQKLLLMEKHGLIGPDQEAVYICAAANASLVAHMERVFKSCNHIKVVTYKHAVLGELKKCIDAIMNEDNGMENVAYAIFDQLEDIRYHEDMESLHNMFIRHSKNASPLKMTWMLLNPYPAWNSTLRCSFLKIAIREGRCTHLDSIIRNTQTIARCFLGFRTSTSLSSSTTLASIPVGYTGMQIFSAVLDMPSVSSMPKDKAAAAVTAVVCNTLKLSHGISAPSVMIIHKDTGPAFLAALDRALVKACGKTENSIGSTAPILVQTVGLGTSVKVETTEAEIKTALDFLKNLKGKSNDFQDWQAVQESLHDESWDVYFYGNLCKHTLLSITLGLVLRQLTFQQQDSWSETPTAAITSANINNQVAILKDFEESLQKWKISLIYSKEEAEKQYPHKPSLPEFLEKFEYLCVLHRCFVDGCEADVVVSVGHSIVDEHFYALTRAKILAVVASVNTTKGDLGNKFGPILTDLLGDDELSRQVSLLCN